MCRSGARAISAAAWAPPLTWRPLGRPARRTTCIRALSAGLRVGLTRREGVAQTLLGPFKDHNRYTNGARP